MDIEAIVKKHTLNGFATDGMMRAALTEMESGYEQKIAGLEDVLRALACSLSAGGYNSNVVDPTVFEKKIRDGIDMLIAPLQERIRQLEVERVPALAEGPKNGVMLEPDDIRFIMEHASIGEAYDHDEACAIVLWVGETIDEDVDAAEVRQYGLNFYNVECPEEGSICIKELPRPAAQQHKKEEE